jgi:hypothetical protein
MFPRGLHYIIYRGNERRQIFLNDIDRGNFLERLGRIGKRRQILISDYPSAVNH